MHVLDSVAKNVKKKQGSCVNSYFKSHIRDSLIKPFRKVPYIIQHTNFPCDFCGKIMRVGDSIITISKDYKIVYIASYFCSDECMEETQEILQYDLTLEY